MKSESLPPWERPLFLIFITFIGGYMNAYTYITRDKILANMHTANMSKLGINIALGQYRHALSFFITISACILGATLSEFIKYIVKKSEYKGDWREIGLILEAIALFGVGFIPTSVPDLIVTNLISFLMGYLICLFRKCLCIPFNTTICTGNLRAVGQLLYDFFDEKTIESLNKVLIFTILTFSFPLGAIPGTLISIALGTKSVWVCSIILLVQSLWMIKKEDY